MSSDLRTVNQFSSKNNDSLVSYHRDDTSFDSPVSYTSSLIVNIRQLHTELHTQYEHEKHTLTELNKHFRAFVDRVQALESQNSKYVAQLADYRRHSSRDHRFDAQGSGDFLHINSDLMSISHAKLDYESQAELFDLQMGIYRQLIDDEQKWKNDQHAKLEQELKHSSMALAHLRQSSTELGQEVGGLFAARQDVFNKYLAIIHDWCSVRKQTKEWQLTLQMLKSHILFYKSIRTSSVR